MSVQEYDFKLSASGTLEINSEARFIYYLSGSGGANSEKISVKHAASGTDIKLMPGQAFELPANAKLGSSWRIGNAGNVGTVSGVVVLGAGAFKDNRMSGVVSVVDGGAARTMGGGALVFSGYAQTGAPAKPFVQMFNPVASGKYVSIKSLMVTSSLDGVLQAGFVNSALGAGVAGYSIKKLAGAGSGVCEIRNGGAAVAQVSAPFLTVGVKAATAFVITFQEPVVLPPGCGFVVEHLTDAAGTFLTVFAEIAEQAG